MKTGEEPGNVERDLLSGRHPFKAGDPIVEVDIKKLSKTYDMSTMLIITNANDKELDFVDPQTVTRGQKVIK